MKYSINLLSVKEAPIVDRVMYFFLNYLRYIIILTQLVVIAVFFYRFQIDQQIVDLKESVDQKKEIIQVVLPLLTEAERIDKRSAESIRIIKNQQKLTTMVQYFLSQFPASINLISLEISPDTLKATGSSSDARQLQAFYSILQKDNKFTTVELQNLRKTDAGYSFILNLIKFKEG